MAVACVTQFPFCCPHKGEHAIQDDPAPAPRNPEEALRLASRQAIVSLLQARPGLTAQEIRKATGRGWGAVVHNLRVLEKAGLAEPVAWGRSRDWYPAGFLGPWRRQAASALRRPGARRVHAAILARPGAFQREMSRALGLDADTVRHHAERLEAAGLAWRDRGRGGTRLYARPTAGW